MAELTIGAGPDSQVLAIGDLTVAALDDETVVLTLIGDPDDDGPYRLTLESSVLLALAAFGIVQTGGDLEQTIGDVLTDHIRNSGDEQRVRDGITPRGDRS
jgi:hypothetical protein